MTNKVDYTELKAKAEAATPGPWTVHTEEVDSPIIAAMELSKLVHGSVFTPVLPMVVGNNGLATAITGCGPTSSDNAAFIAAASPDVVLALIARIAELERDAAPCVWKPEDDDNMPGTYASCCGELWTFTEGGLIENGMKFCHHCGNPIALKEQA